MNITEIAGLIMLITVILIITLLYFLIKRGITPSPTINKAPKTEPPKIITNKLDEILHELRNFTQQQKKRQ